MENDTKYNLPQSGTNDKDLSKEGQNEGDKWTSSDGETASGSGDITPGGRHTYTISSHHTMLKEHLRLATTDKTRLEELVAKLREQLDRQQYDLADARQAIAGKDDTVRIIEERAGRMEIKYATTLDELQTLQHHVTTQEVELKHLREHCEMITKEKAELREQLLVVQQKSSNSEKCPNCTEEKKRTQEDLMNTGESTKKANTLILLQKQKQETERRNEMLVAHLEEVMRQYEMIKKDKETIEAQNIADIKKLQQDTLMWKEKYEDCVARLEVLESECQPQLEESERIISALHHTIQKMEYDKKQDQENWKSKFMKLSAKDRLKLQELNELHEKELRHFENELKNCNAQLNKSMEENDSMSSQLKSKQLKIDELVLEIKTLGINLNTREKICNHLQEELSQCFSEKELLEKRLTDYKVEVKKLLKENKQIQFLEKRVDLLNHSVQQSTVETLKEDHKLKCLIDKIKSISQVTKEPLIKKENDHNNSGDCMEMFNSVNKNQESSKSKKQNDKKFNSSNNNDSDRFDSFTKTEKKNHKTNHKNTSNSKNIDSPFHQTVCDSTSFKINKKTVSSCGDNNKFDAFSNNETILKMYNYESFSNYGLDNKLPDSIIKSSDDTDQQNSVSTDKENDIIKCDKSINAYFFFSTLNFDSSYSNNNSAIKKSLSVQTVIDLEGSSSSYWDDEHTKFLYRRDDVNKINSMLAYQANDSTYSNTNSRSFNKIYNGEYCSLLPPHPINSSTSIKSNCSSGTTGRSSVVMSFLIPFDKFRRWRSDETVSTNTFNKPDSAPYSDVNVPVPTSNILDVHLIPSSSTAGVNHISSVEPELLQLQQKLVLESDKRQSLEKQVNKLIGDLQGKIDQNSNTNQKNVLTSENQEVADGRIRQQALLDSENNLSEKILQINSILQKQMEEQDRIREHSEMQMKKEFELTRQKLLMELSRVQSALKAKEAEERKLREKCDRLTRDVEKNAEIKRRQLIEKSYNINLAQRSSSWEKELSVKARVVVPPPPPPPMTIPVMEDFPLPNPESPFSHNSLRAQLHESIKKHRADSSLDQQSNVGTSNSGTHYDETLESSSKR